MKVLMISLDRTLLGEKVSGGDAIKRHQLYGSFCDELNIIVLSRNGFQKQQLAQNVFVWPTNSTSKLFYVKDAFKIGRDIFKNNKFDLVVSQDPFLTGMAGLKLKNKFKVKLLVHWHGDFFSKEWLAQSFLNRIFIFLAKRIIKKADGLRVVSSGIQKKLLARGVKKDKIRVIATPVDLSKFLTFEQVRLNQLEAKYRREIGQKIIMFVGRLEKEKNLFWFLEVFRMIKAKYGRLKFLIIGEGSLKQELERRVHQFEIDEDVCLLGRIDFDDLTNYYRLADLLVLPSLHESFGKVLVEAGAAGLAVVATATTGSREIVVNEKTGFLVPVGNKKQMQEKILSLLKDDVLREQFGEGARKWVKENFDGDLNVKKIIKFWQELVF